VEREVLTCIVNWLVDIWRIKGLLIPINMKKKTRWSMGHAKNGLTKLK
jgi:hypothetical protein